jgi:AraC-like DNA-binding protein
MSFTYEDTSIDSIFIHKIWHTITTGDGVYTASLDGNWDIIISRWDNEVEVTVNGIGTRAVQVPYVAGIESIGIVLKPNVYLQGFSGKDAVEKQHTLVYNATDYVQIRRNIYKIPNFKTAEMFIEELASHGVLMIDPLVSSYINGKLRDTSQRSLRRHTAQTTGLSPYLFQRIRRAQHATQFLQQGMPIAQTAIEAGYTDQAHMTKAVKLLMGRTPAQIIAEQYP